MKGVLKIQTEFLKMKNTVSEMKYKLDGISSRLNTEKVNSNRNKNYQKWNTKNKSKTNNKKTWTEHQRALSNFR